MFYDDNFLLFYNKNAVMLSLQKMRNFLKPANPAT